MVDDSLVVMKRFVRQRCVFPFRLCYATVYVVFKGILFLHFDVILLFYGLGCCWSSSMLEPWDLIEMHLGYSRKKRLIIWLFEMSQLQELYLRKIEESMISFTCWNRVQDQHILDYMVNIINYRLTYSMWAH